MGDLSKKIKSFRDEFEQALRRIQSPGDIDEVRNQFFSPDKGRFQGMVREIERLNSEKKNPALKQAKDLKTGMLDRLQSLDEKLAEVEKRKRHIDLTLPGRSRYRGAAHPLRLLTSEMEKIFLNLGFDIETSPEVETEYYNWDALNVPADYPARNEGGAFKVEEKRFLRTHAAAAHLRFLERKKPPVRIIVPGKSYHREETGASYLPISFRMDGLMVGQGISFAHFKGILECFVRSLFREKTKFRFRPRYFPFTEPSAAVDVECLFCRGENEECPLCGGRAWIEIACGGMVHSQVFKNTNIDPEKFSGFSFGMEIDRLAMIRYRVPHLKYFYENDLRLIRF